MKRTKAKSEQLGKTDIERTRYYPQSQLQTKQAAGITFSKLFFSYLWLILASQSLNKVPFAY